jgi:NAD(P)-dependent dehydrogenase (short-subunit alcohol dehydrogenase family)
MLTAIVTGSSGSIGAAVCDRLLCSGYRVMGFDLATTYTNAYVQRHFVIDVSNFSDVQRAVDEILNATGAVDALVNCAGISPKMRGNEKAPLWELDLNEVRRVLEVNFMGTLSTCKAVLPTMIARRSGSIVNISSVMASTGGSDVRGTCYPASNSGAHYCASKAAVENLTKTIAREVGEFGVRANCIAPGPVIGGMLQMSAGMSENLLAQIPTHCASNPTDVAEAVVFLLNEKCSRQITGHTLTISGGWVM